MSTRFIHLALAAFLGTFPCARHAGADIATWVDPSGVVNVSNLAPPDGARVLKVVRETPPAIAARNEAAREAARQAEVQALATRVQQLQDEVVETRRQASLAVQYAAAPPPAMPYQAVDVAPPPMQYADSGSAPMNYGCDPTWFNCGFWWGSGVYPASVVVFGSPKFRRALPLRGGHPSGMHPPVMPPPMRPPGAPHRR